MDTDAAENVQADKGAASKTNKVQVDFEDLTTVYGSVTFPQCLGCRRW
jgi:hypothetical protein